MSFFDKIKTEIGKLFLTKDSGKSDQAQEGNKFALICKWIYKLGSVFMAIPVAIAAILLAINNMARLPEQLGVCFPGFEGEKVVVKLLEIDKGTAVIVPVLITAVCLLLMFCSRRQVYPWLISIFSLVLPVFFLIISIFPG